MQFLAPKNHSRYETIMIVTWGTSICKSITHANPESVSIVKRVGIVNLVSLVCLVYLVYLVCLVHSVYLVGLALRDCCACRGWRCGLSRGICRALSDLLPDVLSKGSNGCSESAPKDKHLPRRRLIDSGSGRDDHYLMVSAYESLSQFLH